jgi:hypothetical protein
MNIPRFHISRLIRILFKFMLLLSHSHTHLKVQTFQIEIHDRTIGFVEVNSYGKVWTLWSRGWGTTKNYGRK